MGDVFASSRITGQRTSVRQQRYFKSLKKPFSEHKPKEKKEESEQLQYCQWLRETLPGVHFRSDTGSGAFSSEHAKDIHNRQQSTKGLPDITIMAMRRGYGALCIELKATGESLQKKRDGTKILVRTKKVTPSKRYPSGIKVLERDYKIRLKGDWKDLHTERQHDRMVDLRKAGYYATFARGLEEAKKVTCWYFGLPYVEPLENEPLF